MNINKKRQDPVDKNTTLNHEGAVVHKLNALEEILNRTMGSFMGESGFYDKTTPEKDFARIKELVDQVAAEDKEYILKIAAIGREAGMISYPLAVLTACFNEDAFKGQGFADRNGRNKLAGYTDKVVRRGRDITDILAMQLVYNEFIGESGFPMQEKKNLRRKLEDFDAFKISKALGVGKTISMADAVKILHPGNKHEFFKSVIENRVKFANGKKQVQSEITKVNNENSKSTKEDVKASLADSSLLAIVKNLVALAKAKAIDDETTQIIVDKLTNPNVVRASKVMPYQLYSAYNMFNHGGKNENLIRDALIAAIDMSVDNVANIDGYSAILVDLSGSMDKKISLYSSVSCSDMACLLAAIAVKKSNARVFAFADVAKEVKVSAKSTVIDIMDKIRRTSVGGCTYLTKAMREIERLGDKFDNIIILSDGDAYSYDRRTNRLELGGWGESCDSLCTKLIKNGTFKRFFINNLSARDFTIFNTDDYRKNLVTGFTERYIDEINFSILLQRESADVRKLIDVLYDSYYGGKRR